MKYYSPLLILLLTPIVSSQTCGPENSYDCGNGDSCLYRYVASIGDKNNENYKTLLENDPTLKSGKDTHICTDVENVDRLLDVNGRRDKTTTVTAYYELRGDGADKYYAEKTVRIRGRSAILALSGASTLLISYFMAI